MLEIRCTGIFLKRKCAVMIGWLHIDGRIIKVDNFLDLLLLGHLRK